MHYRLLFSWIFSGLIALQGSLSLADQLSGIKEFSDGTPALAKDVNDNNLVISDKAQELEERILLLENTSDRLVRIDGAAGRVSRSAMKDPRNASSAQGTLVELFGGKLILENIDCTNDPYALNRTYLQNSRFSYIQFTIIGDCYGDLSRRSLGETLDPDEPLYIQEHAQVLAIYPAEDPQNPGSEAAARIIANPDSDALSLNVSFGGALYIHNVDLVAGTNDVNGVLYSRGSTGTLSNVKITLQGGGQTGIRVQHASSPYLANVTIESPSEPSVRGLFLLNNAAVYSYGQLTISGVATGILAISGAQLHSWGAPATISHPDSAANKVSLWIDDSARVSLGSVVATGDIWVREGGDLSVGELTFSGNEIRIDNNGMIGMVPKNSEGAVMSSAELNSILNCTGLATAAIMDSTAADGSANEIPNSECFNTSQWEDFINSLLAP